MSAKTSVGTHGRFRPVVGLFGQVRPVYVVLTTAAKHRALAPLLLALHLRNVDHLRRSKCDPAKKGRNGWVLTA